MAAHYIAELRSVQPHGPYYLGGYCFGSIVAFEMAQTFLREGEEVALLAAFNGPSPVWIRDFWTRRAARQPPRWKRGVQRVGRLIVEPERVVQHLRRKYIWSRQIRLSLKHGRPIPERIRETYFLMLNARAEVAYHPMPYPGLMAVFFGDGLYSDPTLGWSGLAAPLEVYAVPGHHTDNRDLMAEPHVAHVAEQVEKLLAAAAPIAAG
jgi:thioesterase domain-containing protein